MTAPVRRRSLAVGAPEVIEAPRAPWRTVLVLVVVMAGLAFAVTALVDQLGGGSGIALPRLEAPDVSGADVTTARAKLEELGFVVQVLYQPNENATFPKGIVFTQKPRPGAKVPQGDIVTVYVSDGPLGLQVPDVAGQQSPDALTFVQRSGFVGEVVEVPDESIRPGQVVGTDPAAGERVPAGALIRINVSNGPAPRTVPSVVNLTSAQALVELGRAGLAPGPIVREVRTDVAPGAVLSSDPPAGTPLAKDSPVSLTVAIAEERATVPFLIGLLQATAAAVVADAGLQLSVITVPVPAGDPTAGRVVAQGTPPQVEVADGALVQITVAVAVVPVDASAAPPTSGG